MRTDDDGPLPGVLREEERAGEGVAAAAELADTKLADTKLNPRPITGNNRPDTRFRTGISGNPCGRPAGSRNRAVLAREARLAERLDPRLDELVDALLAKAVSGHVAAIRTVLALSLSRRSLDLPGLDLPGKDEAADEPAPNPVFSANNSSSPSAAPAAAATAIAVSSARIQPAPDPDLVERLLTLDAPPGASVAALRACLGDLGVPVRPQDQLIVDQAAPLAGLVAIDPPPDWRVETRSYLVAAPPGTPVASLADFLHSLGIVLGPADRILGAGRAPRPLLVGVAPPLRIAAPAGPQGGGSPP